MGYKRSKKRSYPKKWRKAKGGKLIGRGTYGCIYSPKLDTLQPCSIGNTPEDKKNYITKVISYDNAIDEIKYSDLITSNISNWKDYFIIPNEICLIAPDSTNDERNNFENCKQTIQIPYSGFPITISPPLLTKDIPSDQKGFYYVALNMKKADEDLDGLLNSKNIDISSLDFQELLESMLPLFEGINKLAENEIVHQDIKLANIVFHKKDKKMYLIDVGLSLKHHETFQNPNLHLFSYFIWPVDWKFGFIAKKTGKDIANVLKQTVNNTYVMSRDSRIVLNSNSDPMGFYGEKGIRSGIVDLQQNFDKVILNNKSVSYLSSYDPLSTTYWTRGTLKYIYGGIGANKKKRGPIGRTIFKWVKNRYDLNMPRNIDKIEEVYENDRMASWFESELFKTQHQEYFEFLDKYQGKEKDFPLDKYLSDSNKRLDLFSLAKALSNFMNIALSLKPGKLSKTSGIEEFNKDINSNITEEEEYNSRYSQFFRLMLIFTEQDLYRRPTTDVALEMFRKYLNKDFNGAISTYKTYLDVLGVSLPKSESLFQIVNQQTASPPDLLGDSSVSLPGEVMSIDRVNNTLQNVPASNLNITWSPMDISPVRGGSKKRSKKLKNKRKNKRSQTRRKK